ncbi:helix-turn-helix transcriptional regulator [Nitrosophilus alvini]|uniref:helix-turn-helix transcriptional regulator n=1 Tax=Nitrosophilus alvini TaxID=2714855 RepID=UPI00190A8E20|nr:WYL domain-containing protein [Nitrosophilus alvini]
MNQDIINALPKILRRLSNGETLNIPALSEELGIPQKTIQDNFKKYLTPIENAEVHFDKSVQGWVARQGFLSETLLSEYEIITMQLLEHSSKKYGRQFALATQRLFNRFKRRASLVIFKKTKMEQIGRDDESKLAIIKTAIVQKRVLHCKYNGKDRVVYPLKIVMLEGYWYLFLWDTENNEVRKYHLKSIQALDLQNEIFTTPENRVIDHLDNAINAYFKDGELIPVKLIVHKKISKYFKRQPLSGSQSITQYPYNENYEYLNIWVTDEMEIIPTIQQYLPYIKVESPDSLCQQIEKNIQNYSNFDFQE